LFLCACVALAASCIAPQAIERNGFTTDPAWYTVDKIRDNVWMINETGHFTTYLIEGNDSAMLVDAGIGVGSLARLVGSLTDKPVIAVATHGHYDHIGADYQFAKVYLPEDDKFLYDQIFPNTYISLKNKIAKNPELQAIVDKDSNADSILRAIANYPETEVCLYKEGKSFDLGGVMFETVRLAGHTPGSTMFVNRSEGYALGGDACVNWLLLFFDYSCSPQQYMDNILCAKGMLSGVKSIYSGHQYSLDPYDISYLDTMYNCIGKAVRGEHLPQRVKHEIIADSVNCYIFDNFRFFAR